MFPFSHGSTRRPYIFHPPPRRRGSTATHAKTIHAPSTEARGSISDHIWIHSTSHPFRIRFGIISHHLVTEAKKVFGRSYPKAERFSIRTVPKQNRET
uniref:Uncharacterized protein n=1 Tax=Caenorhabditis japonica TaxID=281687 RepID=A0A8R1IJX9_CAEJA